MIETRDKSIEGANYSVTQLPARRAIRLKAKLIKMFGPVIAQFITMGGEINFEKEHDNIVKAMELLGQHIDENSFEQLCTEILSSVRKNGIELSPAVIDLEFAGDLATLYKVIWFAIEVNFGSFFSWVGIGNQSETPPVPSMNDIKKTYGRN